MTTQDRLCYIIELFSCKKRSIERNPVFRHLNLLKTKKSMVANGPMALILIDLKKMKEFTNIVSMKKKKQSLAGVHPEIGNFIQGQVEDP